MDHYQGLLWKTRGGTSPQGRPRVYLCCHPNDFGWLFREVCEEILDVQRNAAIWYYDPEETIPLGDEFLDDLSQMQLFVIPVTSSFLYMPSQARDLELPLALKDHVPVLPLMREEGLEESYTRVLGDLQYLDRAATEADPTAIPYKERLERYLSSILVGDELARRVRAAFDAYVFLSYRKRDRAAAQRVMRLIHWDSFCRDVAIWYDEYLIPGEGFNQAILDALERCDVFALVVTPKLLENPNYVLTKEWPAACAARKPVLPVETEPTDAMELARLYKGLGDAIPEVDRVAVAERLKELLQGIVLAENDTDPTHIFLVGLAYLTGIDVEVNHERASELITAAAEADLTEAIERLVAMYNAGEGVERDYRTAITWQRRLVRVLRDRLEEGPDSLKALIHALRNLGDQLFAVGDSEEALAAYKEMLDVAKVLDAAEDLDGRRLVSSALTKLGNVQSSLGDTDGALELYKQSLDIDEALATETGTVEARSDLSIALRHVGYVRRSLDGPADALALYEKSLAICEDLADETGSVESRRNLSASIESVGDARYYMGDPAGALEMYERSLAIDESLAYETCDAEDRRDLSVSLGRVGDARRVLGDLTGALALYERSLEIDEVIASETLTVRARRDLSAALDRIGDIRRALGNQTGAVESYKRSLVVAEALAKETRIVDAWDDLGISHYKLGQMEALTVDERKSHIEQALSIGERLLKQTGLYRYEYFVQTARELLEELG